ncbi:hypothetical protein [Rhodococcoides fascians]|uniref:hypothetical protein n=1 Tax=Rhodococcoides fascians TaxID=1828 RepID=UPI000564F68A|nr:hypothetical protein [Rhodococcus fascians]
MWDSDFTYGPCRKTGFVAIPYGPTGLLCHDHALEYYAERAADPRRRARRSETDGYSRSYGTNPSVSTS